LRRFIELKNRAVSEKLKLYRTQLSTIPSAISSTTDLADFNMQLRAAAAKKDESSQSI
jgi:hypothetical protein